MERSSVWNFSTLLLRRRRHRWRIKLTTFGPADFRNLVKGVMICNHRQSPANSQTSTRLMMNTMKNELKSTSLRSDYAGAGDDDDVEKLQGIPTPPDDVCLMPLKSNSTKFLLDWPSSSSRACGEPVHFQMKLHGAITVARRSIACQKGANVWIDN